MRITSLLLVATATATAAAAAAATDKDKPTPDEAYALSPSDDCIPAVFIDEKDGLARLANEEFHPSWGRCASTAMRRGWWDLAKEIVLHSKKSGAKSSSWSSTVHRANSDIKRHLSEISTLMSAPSSAIAPAFQWSESGRHVYLNIKFAHKLDTPATLGVVTDSMDFGRRSFTFRGTSKRTAKRFNLDLKLAGDIVPSQSTFAYTSVGRATVTMAKACLRGCAWDRLLDRKEKKPRNMHRWFKMDEKHADGLEKAREASKEERDEKKEAKAKAGENGEEKDEAKETNDDKLESKDGDTLAKHDENEESSSVIANALDGISRWASGTEAQEKSKAAKEAELTEKKGAARAAHRARAAAIGAAHRVKQVEVLKEADEKAKKRDAKVADSKAQLETRLQEIERVEEETVDGEL